MTERPRTHDPDRLRELRVKARLTMPALAELAGVALGTVSRAESGNGGVRVETLHRLADALGVDVGTLMPHEEAKSA